MTKFRPLKYFADLIGDRKRVRAEREAMREATITLRGMSDIALKDIGMARGDIHHCIRNGRWFDSAAKDE